MIRARPLALLLVAWALALVACSPTVGTLPGAGAERADLVRLTLLQVNDDYSLEPVDDGRRGGMARLAALVRETRRDNPHTIFALAGDTISPSVMSTFLRGEQMIAGFNAAGLDVATFGNHEFDFGAAVLRERMRESKFLWVSANVRERGSGRPFGGARADLLLTLGGIKLGVYGLTMPDTAATSSPGPDVVFTEPLAAARETAARLRAQGAQLVVAVTHQMMADDRALADKTDVDVILGGHEHEPLVAEEGKTLITKAGSDGRYVVEVDLWLTRAGALVERSWTFREVSGRVAPDPAVAELVNAYAQRMSRELDTVAGRSATPLEARGTKLRTQETNLGDFVADLMRERMRTDVAFLNGGAVRTDRVVPAGPLTKRDVHSLLPFNNVVMTIELPGRDLRSALEQGLAQADRVGGGFLQVAGLRLKYDPRRPAGERLVQVEVGGQPLDASRAYTVAVSSYLAHGGDGFTAFSRARVLVDEESGPQLADLVLRGLTSRGTIAPEVDGRIQPVQP